MEPCVNHPDVMETQPCADCKKSFCKDCLVELQGAQYCGSCKLKFVRTLQKKTAGFKLPREALTYSIVGIICFGFILEPIAFFKALKALRLIKNDPKLPGRGTAIAALIISIIFGLLHIFLLLLQLVTIIIGSAL